MSAIALLKKIPLATALIECFEQGYGKRELKADLVAALIVSLVALPLSMALSIAVGLPPQNGLYTAIVAGIVAAVFGGSRLQVSGPTAAFVVIVAPIVAEFGLRGIIWCQILSGLLLIALGISRLGRVVSLVPYPVTTGFTAGIAVVIATIALNDFLGLGLPGGTGHWPQKVAALYTHIDAFNAAAFGVGVLALLIMIYLPKVTKAVPSSIVGIAVATGVAYILGQQGIGIDTIGSRFTYTLADGGVGHGVPPYPPTLAVPGFSSDPLFALPSVAELSAWFPAALTIAALAALESLLSATVADSMKGTRHNPDAELNGIGLGNIFSGMASGVPATGAIARTATNINAGGHSPLASVFHAVLLLAYMLILAPAIAYVPMSALSALLLMTAWRMSHAPQFLHMMKTSPKSDVAVLITCFFFTVMIDMVAGVLIGFTLAVLIFFRRMMRTMEVESHEPANVKLPANTLLFRVDGPLFFGTAERAFERSQFLQPNVHTIILDMHNVPMIDATGLHHIASIANDLHTKGGRVKVVAPYRLMKTLRKQFENNPKIGLYDTLEQAVAAHS